MTVLVVEDDGIILEGLRFALEQEGYQVLAASTMAQAMEMIESGQQVDIYLLDVMLPDGDGYQICCRIRNGNVHNGGTGRGSDVPILFLTACDDEVSTVRALEQGADDYIAKPFRIRELIARMKANLRRSVREGQSPEETAKVGENQVHLHTGRVYRDGVEIILTAMEYKLLLIFLNNRGQTLSRKQILDRIWDAEGDFVNDNMLSVYIKRLRRKLNDSPEGRLICTVRGLGYRMEV